LLRESIVDLAPFRSRQNVATHVRTTDGPCASILLTFHLDQINHQSKIIIADRSSEQAPRKRKTSVACLLPVVESTLVLLFISEAQLQLQQSKQQKCSAHTRSNAWEDHALVVPAREGPRLGRAPIVVPGAVAGGGGLWHLWQKMSVAATRDSDATMGHDSI
jgi:hypothetical protein